MPRLVAFIPHPDDESYSVGGTIALAARAGWDCHVFCASSGERGKRHDGGATDAESFAAAREAELAGSCEVLGAKPPAFWHVPDGRFSAPPNGEAFVRPILASFRPDVVLTLGSDGAYGHPDHTALHRWVVQAWTAAAEPRPALLFPVFPKGLFLPQWEKCRHMLGDPPEPPAEALGSNAWHYEVPVASVREVKRASIAAHRSQLPGGEVEAIFPPGIVAGLLGVERFEDAGGKRHEATAKLLRGLTR